MGITLTPELENLISEEMKTGNYVSPTDVLHQGLLYLRANKLPREIRLENLRREVQKGVNAVREGNFKTYDSAEEMMENVIYEACSEFEAKKKNGK